MYDLKCYYHPKHEATQQCVGCKMPICMSCEAPQGRCCECEAKHEAVRSLHVRRTTMLAAAAESAGGVATATRMRSALPQAPTQRTSSRPKPAVATGTRTLNDTYAFTQAAPRRYSREEIAYKPVGNPLRESKKVTTAKKPSWVLPFAFGLVVGLGFYAMHGLEAPDTWTPSRDVASLSAHWK